MTSAAPRPPPPSKWAQRNLDELNATFDSHKVIRDFKPPVFIPPKVQVGMALCPSFCLQFLISCTVIDNIAKELEKVNGSKTITPPFKFAVSQAPSLAFFKTFYERLDTLLSLENPPKQPSAENLYTTPPNYPRLSSQPHPRLRIQLTLNTLQPQTPHQPRMSLRLLVSRRTNTLPTRLRTISSVLH